MKDRVFCLGRPILDINIIINNSSRIKDIFSVNPSSLPKEEISKLSISEIISNVNKKEDLLFSIGGVEFNFGINCSLLGLPSILAGVIGDDNASLIFKEKLKICLEETKILSAIINEKENNNTCSILVAWIPEKKEISSYKRVKIVDYGASCCLDCDLKLKKELKKSTIFFSSLFSANTEKIRPIWREFVQLANSWNKKVIINIGGVDTIPIKDRKDILDIVNNSADIIFMNQHEYKYCENPIRKILKKVEICIVTYGEKGALIHSGREKIIINSSSVRAKNDISKIGIGDAFAAAFTCALHRNYSLKDAGEFASRVATLKLDSFCSHLNLNLINQLKGVEDHTFYR